MNIRRLLPLSAVGFVAVVVLAVALTSSEPDGHADPAKVAGFYDGSADGIVAAFALAATAPFLVAFAAALAQAARPERGAWAGVLRAGAALEGAILVGVGVLKFALEDGGEAGLSPVALQTLNLVYADAWVALGAGMGVVMIGAAGCLLGRAGAAGWLGGAAAPLAVCLFFPYTDFVAMLATLVWIVVAGFLLREPRMQAVAAPAAA